MRGKRERRIHAAFFAWCETCPMIAVRPARAGDDSRLLSMVHALSPETLRRRFLGGTARDVAVDELRREVRAGTDAIALVAEDASGELLGVAYAARTHGRCWEAAFVVRDASQHHGIGTSLFAAVVSSLVARGAETMRLDVLADNRPMLAIVRECGLSHAMREQEGTVQVTVQLRGTAAGRAS
jgi:GNAT superfamily N-acetyltransferase